MKKREIKIIESALDELMLGDDGNFGKVIYTLGKLVGREYKQFAIIKNVKLIPINDVPNNSEFRRIKCC